MPADFPEATSLSLLDRARSADQEAWQRIVRLYGPLVFAWCRRSGLPEEDVSDIFQEVFRAVSTGLSKFSPAKATGSFRSWLRTIARSKIANHFQRANRQPRAAGGTHANQQLAEFPDPLDGDSEDDAAADHEILVRQALELVQPEFNKKTWQAFRRIAIDGQDTADAAAALEMSPEAVRQANYRVRRRLRLELEGLIDWR